MLNHLVIEVNESEKRIPDHSNDEIFASVSVDFLRAVFLVIMKLGAIYLTGNRFGEEESKKRKLENQKQLQSNHDSCM